ncbi:MAG: NCS2 family permease [Planctomycetota bacterium]|jgi:AGZA family xanthine/uracil permease-like MFS transporter
MLDRYFRLTENGTNVRTELVAGLTTFLTMAYIIVLQPMILSGSISGGSSGPHHEAVFGSIMTATCLAAALATLLMAFYARYPIAQAPGMGENFFFLATVALVAGKVGDGTLDLGDTQPWQVALGVVFVAGLLFLLISALGLQAKLMEAISPSMRNAVAVGIGLFIAFIGLKNASLVLIEGGTIRLNSRFGSPDLVVFFFGLLVTAALHSLRVRGSIIWGILAATVLAVGLHKGLPLLPGWIAESELVTESRLIKEFAIAERVVAAPPSMAPTFLQMDLAKTLSLSALRYTLPLILIFLFMDVFDTLGTLIGVSEQAGLVKDGKLPRMKEALVSDAVGTAAGAAFGTSTVTSFIESAAGVEQGGRTGLTAAVVAVLFLAALFFSPVIAMVGSYPPITAPALVVVGSMMMRNVTKIEWSNYAESMPAFLIVVGIPLTYSIGDGLALGFLTYPVVKLLAGQGRDVKWLMWVMAVVLVAYFVLVRVQAG